MRAGRVSGIFFWVRSAAWGWLLCFGVARRCSLNSRRCYEHQHRSHLNISRGGADLPIMEDGRRECDECLWVYHMGGMLVDISDCINCKWPRSARQKPPCDSTSRTTGCCLSSQPFESSHRRYCAMRQLRTGHRREAQVARQRGGTLAGPAGSKRTGGCRASSVLQEPIP